METGIVDIFATKGVEYILVIGYLALLVPFVFLLGPKARRARAAAPAGLGWFDLPEGFSFHPGHAWALADGEGVVRVGMDDFAGKFVGPPAKLDLPIPGAALVAGGRGWHVENGPVAVDMVSPVDGEVLEVNPEAVKAPGSVAQDPYGAGWLMKVRVAHPKTALKNLMSGKLARAWIDQTAEALLAASGNGLGALAQDGGQPAPGFALWLPEDARKRVAERFFLAG